MDVTVGVDGQPLVPAAVWRTWPPAAQAVIVALAQQVVALAAEVRALKARLGQHSTNSSRPPSSDLPSVPRRRAAPAPPSGRRAGGQPGHVGHFRALVPSERVDVVVDHWPDGCGGCATPFMAALVAPPVGDADYVAHQVTEHRLHRVACPRCGAMTRATLPADVPAGAFGPRLQATVATLSGRFRLSRREVAEVCETVLEAPSVPTARQRGSAAR